VNNILLVFCSAGWLGAGIGDLLGWPASMTHFDCEWSAPFFQLSENDFAKQVNASKASMPS
jgi:hypothetical protein